MALWSGLTVNDTNLNKMVMGDGTGTGIYSYLCYITSDGLGSGTASFTLSNLAGAGVSVSAYSSDIISITISGRTMTSANTIVHGTSQGSNLAGDIMQVYDFSAGVLRVVFYSDAGAKMDIDSTSCSFWLEVITTAAS